MAKEYSAKLTLQDNWNQVIDKAIIKTGKLLKEAQKLGKIKVNPEVNIKTNKALMKTVQSDLKKLEKSNINIKTKLNSSFQATVNAIQKAVPNKKVVSIEAKENVTKTLNNVERYVFTKTNKVNSILKGSIKGMSSSINTSLSPLGKLATGLSSLSRILSLFRNTGGRGLLGFTLIGGVAGRTVIGRVDSSNQRESTNRRITLPLDANNSLLNKMSSNASKMKGTFGKAFRDVVKNAQNKLSGIVSAKDIGDELNEGLRGGYRGIWNWGSNFNKMIQQQKQKLRQLGVSSPLSQYQRQ